MTASEDERRVLRDAIDVLKRRGEDPEGDHVGWFRRALAAHKGGIGSCVPGPNGEQCAAVKAAREVLETIR